MQKSQSVFLQPYRVKPLLINAFASLFFFLSASLSHGQERIQQAKKYQGGDRVVAPLYGLEITVLPHWSGYLPQDIELFTFRADTAKDVDIIMYASKNTHIDEIRQQWRSGQELSPGLGVVPDESIVQNDTMGYTSIKMTHNRSMAGYAMATCGSFGTCYTLLLRTTATKAALYKDVLPAFAENVRFFDPTLVSPYDLYDWNKELSNKYLVLFENSPGQQKQNHIWLCADGTFKAKIQRKGLMKEEIGKYKGNQSGTFEIQGTGKTGTLTLKFKKLDTLTIDLEIKENNLTFLNGKRYFVSENLKCK